VDNLLFYNSNELMYEGRQIKPDNLSGFGPWGCLNSDNKSHLYGKNDDYAAEEPGCLPRSLAGCAVAAIGEGAGADAVDGQGE
jgi:hypothetical protein